MRPWSRYTSELGGFTISFKLFCDMNWFFMFLVCTLLFWLFIPHVMIHQAMLPGPLQVFHHPLPYGHHPIMISEYYHNSPLNHSGNHITLTCLCFWYLFKHMSITRIGAWNGCSFRTRWSLGSSMCQSILNTWLKRLNLQSFGSKFSLFLYFQSLTQHKWKHTNNFVNKRTYIRILSSFMRIWLANPELVK